MRQRLGQLYLVGAFFLAGSSVVAGKFLSGKLGIFTITAISLSLALLPLLAAEHQGLTAKLKHMSWRSYLLFLFQATCGIFLFRVFLLKGLNYTSATEAGILTGATPALTALMAWLFLQEVMDGLGILSIAATATGIMLIQGWLLSGEGLRLEHLLGNALVLGAALCESTFNVLSRLGNIKLHLHANKGINPIQQTMIVTGIALLLCLPPAYSEHSAAQLISLGYCEWFALLWYGLVVTALGYVLWYAGIERCDASTAAAFSGMMPFTSLILSLLLLGERPALHQLLGGVLIVLAMMLTSKKTNSNRTTLG